MGGIRDGSTPSPGGQDAIRAAMLAQTRKLKQLNDERIGIILGRGGKAATRKTGNGNVTPRGNVARLYELYNGIDARRHRRDRAARASSGTPKPFSLSCAGTKQRSERKYPRLPAA